MLQEEGMSQGATFAEGTHHLPEIEPHVQVGEEADQLSLHFGGH